MSARYDKKSGFGRSEEMIIDRRVGSACSGHPCAYERRKTPVEDGGQSSEHENGRFSRFPRPSFVRATSAALGVSVLVVGIATRSLAPGVISGE